MTPETIDRVAVRICTQAVPSNCNALPRRPSVHTKPCPTVPSLWREHRYRRTLPSVPLPAMPTSATMHHEQLNGSPGRNSNPLAAYCQNRVSARCSELWRWRSGPFGTRSAGGACSVPASGGEPQRAGDSLVCRTASVSARLARPHRRAVRSLEPRRRSRSQR